MKKPKLNVRLLRRVQRHIAKEPLRFRIGWWIKKGEIHNQPNPPCNTTACIAGTALLLAGKRIRQERASSTAGKLLGIEKEDRDKLFVLEEWPRKFRDKYVDDVSFLFGDPMPLTKEQVKRNARIAIKRIDHFIKYRK